VPLDLSPVEFELLATLALHRGRYVARHKLLAIIWHRPGGTTGKVLQFHLDRLRRKLGESSRDPCYLQSTRSLGIKLVAPRDAVGRAS
jgi:two-component system alkaline phosphatase synthesis response regulator PhoP